MIIKIFQVIFLSFIFLGLTQTRYAVTVFPGRGLIYFTQTQGYSLQVNGTIIGLNVAHNQYEIHVHEFGDTSLGCQSVGEHYNPTNQAHGERDSSVRHVGDLGRIPSFNGVSIFAFNDTVASLFGDFSIIGRSIVLHDVVGHSGFHQQRLICGIIGYRNTTRIKR